MDEAVLVCECKRAADVDPQLERGANGQPPLTLDQLLQVLAVDVLEDDELATVGLPAVDDGDDVRMLDSRGNTRLTPEAIDVIRVALVMLVEDLDRNRALQQAVTRAIDTGHAALADELLELVSARDQLADHRAPIFPAGYGLRASEDALERVLPDAQRLFELGVSDDKRHEHADDVGVDPCAHQ